MVYLQTQGEKVSEEEVPEYRIDYRLRDCANHIGQFDRPCCRGKVGLIPSGKEQMYNCMECGKLIDASTSCCFDLINCPMCWSSHGCSLKPGHEGTHTCILPGTEVGYICSQPTMEYGFEEASVFDFRVIR